MYCKSEEKDDSEDEYDPANEYHPSHTDQDDEDSEQNEDSEQSSDESSESSSEGKVQSLAYSSFLRCFNTVSSLALHCFIIDSTLLNLTV